MARKTRKTDLLVGFRSGSAIKKLLANLKKETSTLNRRLRIMEVCGTHTMTLHRSGLKPLLKECGIEMISGPGCPVCITPDYYHEAIIKLLTGRHELIVATFGDMTRVPTRSGALQTAVPASGSLIRIVYSPEESLELARKNPGKQVLFFGAGFETTIPAIAFTVKKARKDGLNNFSLLAALWLIPPALEAILKSGEVALDGFIYPGHVSTIIGEKAYDFVARKYNLPGAIAGFEPVDVLMGVLAVVRQIKSGQPAVANEYRRAVRPEGNPVALSLMEEVFETFDADWRGLGVIPASGLKLKPEWADFEATRRFELNFKPQRLLKTDCRCGEVLKGLINPADCPLFGKICNPDHPLGPCMVSYEGACLIEYRYSSGVKWR